MKKNNFVIIQSSFPDIKSAKKLSKILLEKKLAACIHLQKIESLYIWQENIENAKEISVSIKTSAANFSKIEKIIKQNHPYKIPQIFAVEMLKLSTSYQSWIETNIA
jgi:periplasmic divalent cation tolerance protein